jgi:precorrin-2/cobalt-factor-2 C20-methyltransferase
VLRLRPGLAIETVPGIMAFQDLAARAGTVLLDGAEELTLLTTLDGTASLERALAQPERAVVVYKGGRHLPAIAAALHGAGRLDGAVMGELLGLPGERVCPLSDAAERPASYLATVVVPPKGRGG